MKYLQYISLLTIIILPLLGCQKSNKYTNKIDNKSYINSFELIQENPTNQTSIKIISPKAIIDPKNNDIEIIESSIEIFNKNGQDFTVKSGNSTLNNLSKSIKVFNNVNISFLKNPDYYITTNSFEWDLKTSIIDINNRVNINFDNTMINATNGSYNINSGLLNIDNSEFNRNEFNSNGEDQYLVNIKSDYAKWFKKENTLVFTSNDRQAETTINFLLTE